MYNTVWNMEDLDLDYAKTDINCGTDLMFYIEMDPPGNTAVFLQKANYVASYFILFLTATITEPLQILVFINLF